jgi:hypothetical protein
MVAGHIYLQHVLIITYRVFHNVCHERNYCQCTFIALNIADIDIFARCGQSFAFLVVVYPLLCLSQK